MDWQRYDALTQRQRDLSRRIDVLRRGILAADHASGEDRFFSYNRHAAPWRDPRYGRWLHKHSRCLMEQFAMARAEFPDLAPGVAHTLVMAHRIDRGRIGDVSDAELLRMHGIGWGRLREIRRCFPYRHGRSTKHAVCAVAAFGGLALWL